MPLPRSLLAVAPAVFLASCSLADQGNGLEQVWRVEASSDALLGSIGATDGERFYAERGHTLAAYSAADGALVWEARISRFCAPPAVAAGRVFCPSDDLTALDAETGRILWSVTPDSTFQLVKGAADAERVYAGTLSTVHAFDAATGALVWARSVRDRDWVGVRNRSLVLGGDTLFVTAHGEYSENGYLSASAVVALDAATGRELWRFQDGDGTDSQKIGGLAVTPDALLYSDPENGQQVVAVDRATREVRWRAERRPGYLGTLRAPEVVDGVAYIADGDERLRAIDVATGRVLWDVQPDRESYRNHEVCGPYLVGDNTALTVVDRATGDRVEVLFRGADENVRQLAEWGGRLFVATDRAVYGFDCE